MRKNLFLLGMMVSSMGFAQTGMVGINNTAPTEALDVEGNGRIRILADGADAVDFPKVVVAKDDGTLGKRDFGAFISRTPLINIIDHPATGLKWNTNDDGARGGTAEADRPKGPQKVFDNYLVFGVKNDVNASVGNYTNGNTSFTANAGEFLTIEAIINFEVQKNGATSDANKALNDMAVNGDRQVVIYLYLYKGNTMIRKVKQIVNFRGRNYNTAETDITGTTANILSKGFDSEFSQPILMNYLVPAGGDASDYSVSVVVTARAPYDGNFRLNLQDHAQKLLVTK